MDAWAWFFQRPITAREVSELECSVNLPQDHPFPDGFGQERKHRTHEPLTLDLTLFLLTCSRDVTPGKIRFALGIAEVPPLIVFFAALPHNAM